MTPETCVDINVYAWVVVSLAYLAYARKRFLIALWRVFAFWFCFAGTVLSIHALWFIKSVRKADPSGIHWPALKFLVYSLSIPIALTVFLVASTILNIRKQNTYQARNVNRQKG